MMDKKDVSQYLNPLTPIPTTLEPAPNPRYPVKCVLFDIYGTLFMSDSGDIGILSKKPEKSKDLKQLADSFHLRQSPENLIHGFISAIKDYHETKTSSGIKYPEVDVISIWNHLLNQNNHFTEIQVKEFAIRFELIVNPVYPMPGVEHCLEFCRNSNIKLGIISNAQFYTPLLFEWYFSKNLSQLGFDQELIIYSYRYGIAKPSPQLFEVAANYLANLGIEKRNTVYLGNDMLKDIFPAQQIGFQTALFAGDRRSLRLRDDNIRCKDLKPDMVITELVQIEGWFS